METNNIKHIEFAEVPTETGEGGSEITMAFKENYFQKYDIFRIDKSKQQCIVISHPIRKRDELLLIVSLNKFFKLLGNLRERQSAARL